MFDQSFSLLGNQVAVSPKAHASKAATFMGALKNKRHALKGILSALFLTALMAGCTSSQHAPVSGPKIESGVVYGSTSGPCRPFPQSKPVNLNGVKGAKITSEKYSIRGNKDYRVLGKNYVVWRDLDSYFEEGTASWYGPGFHGQRTSNGEHYNMEGFTAAHKNLPLPSFLKVTNLENGKAVIVRVNDRGPFHGNRILDLSKGAARSLGVIGKGTAKVRLELVKPNLGPNQTSIAQMNGFKPFIQVFSTSNRDRATQITRLLKSSGHIQSFIEAKNGVYRIKVGPIAENEASNTISRIKNLGYGNAFFTAE